MRAFRLLAISWIVASLAASAAAVLAQPVARRELLTTPGRMTLYTFDNDVAGSGRSACNAPCSGLFPPFLAKKGDKASGEASIITRDDGTLQWAYKGKPLYRWVYDEKPGDKKGDGVNHGTWHVAKP